MEGAQKEGALGLAKGVAHGIAGVVAGPVGGALSDVSRATSVCAGAVQGLRVPDIHRIRRPRPFSHTGALVPFHSAIDVFEIERIVDNTWSKENLSTFTDGPAWSNFDGKEATKESLEIEHRLNPAAAAETQAKASWQLDRFGTNFHGWKYADTYRGPYEPHAGPRTHYRRRRWVLDLSTPPPAQKGQTEQQPHERTAAQHHQAGERTGGYVPDVRETRHVDPQKRAEKEDPTASLLTKPEGSVVG
jgi:hypothetical protein